MALFADYASWVAGVKDFIEADDFSDSQIQTFLYLAQDRMNREYSGYWMEKRLDYTIPATPLDYIDLSVAVTDFNKIRAFGDAVYGDFERVPLDRYLRFVAGTETVEKDTKRYYCIDATRAYIYPALVEAEVINIFYYMMVPQISSVGPVNSNVFTDYYSDGLLYAACLEAAAYMIEDERIPIWSQKYGEALAVANDVSARIKAGSTPLKRKISTYGG